MREFVSVVLRGCLVYVKKRKEKRKSGFCFVIGFATVSVVLPLASWPFLSALGLQCNVWASLLPWRSPPQHWAPALCPNYVKCILTVNFVGGHGAGRDSSALRHTSLKMRNQFVTEIWKDNTTWRSNLINISVILTYIELAERSRSQQHGIALQARHQNARKKQKQKNLTRHLYLAWHVADSIPHSVDRRFG